MDPITAALELATSVVKLWTLILESTPEPERAKLAAMMVADIEAWRAFVAQFKAEK